MAYYTKGGYVSATPSYEQIRRQRRMSRIANRDGWMCHYCGVRLVAHADMDAVLLAVPPRRDMFGNIWDDMWELPGDIKIATIDHAAPTSCGGGEEDANLLLACHSCNSGKGNKFTPEEYKARRGRAVTK